jgi:polysaccharide biosynthesis transport protein
MDFGHLLQILSRRKWLILSAMLASAGIVFYLIGKKPERYKANIIMATGIVNYKGFNSNGDDAFVQQFQIENAFSNLIDFAQSRSSFKLLSLYMLQHDLNAEKGNNTDWPFRKPDLSIYGPGIHEEAEKLRIELSKIRLDSISDPAFSQELDYLIDRVSRTYGYDHDAIGRSLTVKRKGTTDYLSIEFVTENAKLSQYIANAYVNLFMNYYQNLSVREKRKNVQFYRQLAAEKKAVVDTIKNRRYAYLYRKGLPALGKQSEELVTQIGDLELQKQKAESKRLSSAEAVGKIQQYIDTRGNMDAGETRARVVDKYNVADLNAKVRTLTEKSAANGGKDAKLEAELAGARHALDMALQSSAGNLGKSNKNEDARRTKEDLFKEKVQADMDRIEAEKSIGTLESEIRQRTDKLSVYVTNDEVATGLSSDQENADEEFKKVNDELINANLALANAENPLHVIENAQLPEWPEPNRRTLLSIFAAIVVGTLSVLTLFVLAFLDNSIQSPEMFGRYTGGLPLLGYTPYIKMADLDFQRIFSTNGEMPQFSEYRENLRKMRNQLLAMNAKVFLFTSTRPQQGKTSTGYALANALAANHKKVLILDTNFKTPLPSELTNTNTNHVGPVAKILRKHDLSDTFYPGSVVGVGQGLVMVVAHFGIHISPAEMLPPDQFKSFLDELGEHFDYIFLEAAALNQFSDAQELIPFADKVIAVFNANAVLNSRDKTSLDYLKGLGSKYGGSILAGVDSKNMAK